MRHTGPAFIALLWVAGILTGIVVARAPAALPLPTPQISVPLALALVLDLSLLPLVRAGRARPLTFYERAIGVIGAGILAILVSAASAG